MNLSELVIQVVNEDTFAKDLESMQVIFMRYNPEYRNKILRQLISYQKENISRLQEEVGNLDNYLHEAGVASPDFPEARIVEAYKKS